MEKKDKALVVGGLVGGLIGFAIIIGVVGQGNVRHVEIFYPEKVEQTIAFRDVDGKVTIVGIKGIGEEGNPTLIMRTSFAYVLTVINQGTQHHRLYIDGFEVQTDLLEPGQEETLVLFPEEEGTYQYYDKRQFLKPLGELKAVEVVPSDSFEGFLKDMI